VTLTLKLLDFLHRVFDKDPAPSLALRITCDSGALTWTISGSTLTLAPVGGLAPPLTVDLSDFTVASLAQYLTSLPGYLVPYLDPSPLSALSALVLIEGEGDVAQSNGDHLFAFTTPLWCYMRAQAAQLTAAQLEILNMLAQMSTTTAAADGLAFLGSYYFVPRNGGELDDAYALRIITSVLLPSSNNVGMQIALQSRFPGTTAIIIDAILDQSTLLLRDGSVHFDSTAVHNSLVLGDSGGLFDVVFAFDFAGPISPTNYLPLLIAAINSYRAGGTYIRQISLKDGLTAGTLVSSTYTGSILVNVYTP
jgi:hypothetical protein